MCRKYLGGKKGRSGEDENHERDETHTAEERRKEHKGYDGENTHERNGDLLHGRRMNSLKSLHIHCVPKCRSKTSRCFPNANGSARRAGRTEVSATWKDGSHCAFSTSEQTQKLIVKGMKCEVCVKNVKNALLDVDGVVEARVDLDSGTCHVATSRDVTREELVRTVESVGFEIEQDIPST